jgi:hypothetical protein
MVSAGFGYWLDKSAPGILEPSPHIRQASDELTLFSVFSVINNATNPKAWGASVEYRHRFETNLDGTLTYIYEGNPKVARRSGVAGQFWPVRKALANSVEVGAGFGAYFFIDRRNQPNPNKTNAVAAAGLISIMASYDLSERWLVRAIWDRVITNYNRDADIWRLGVGYKL